jgi:2-keto-4-pentenoate hydratase
MTSQLSERAASLVDKLLQARRTGVAVDPAGLPKLLTPEEVYGVQDACAARGGWFAGGKPRAWKLGVPDATGEASAAPLPDSGLMNSPAQVPASVLPRPGVEAEVALIIGRDLGSADAVGPTRVDLEAVIESMCVSIEIIDSRFADHTQVAAPVKLADLQTHGGLVCGSRVPFRLVDWKAQRCRLVINGETRSDTRGTHPAGEPLAALRWLIAHAVSRHGGLRRGDVITTGAWCGIVPAAPGSRVEVYFDGIGEAHAVLGGG